VVLASLATQSPLLLIGPHGSAKSLLLERLADAHGLRWRHYNAVLVNFDDLGGYQKTADGGIEPVLAIHRRTMETCAKVFVDADVS
jgi:hypothetical protein